MAEGPEDGRASGDPTRTEVTAEGESDEALPKYGPWVSVYGFLHRSVDRRSTVFGGSVAVGSFVLVRQFYSFVSAPTEWPGLHSWTVVGGIFLFGFGIGYFVIREETACPKCGRNFSRERIGKRPAPPESLPDAPERAYVEESYECRHCGRLTTELYAHPEWEYPRG